MTNFQNDDLQYLANKLIDSDDNASQFVIVKCLSNSIAKTKKVPFMTFMTPSLLKKLVEVKDTVQGSKDLITIIIAYSDANHVNNLLQGS
jgi:hypothetical protein